MKTPWIDTPHESYRWVRKFAWLPVRTFDHGWIHFKAYWVHEKVWGWGFHDKYPYLFRTQTVDNTPAA